MVIFAIINMVLAIMVDIIIMVNYTNTIMVVANIILHYLSYTTTNIIIVVIIITINMKEVISDDIAINFKVKVNILNTIVIDHIVMISTNFTIPLLANIYFSILEHYTIVKVFEINSIVTKVAPITIITIIMVFINYNIITMVVIDTIAIYMFTTIDLTWD